MRIDISTIKDTRSASVEVELCESVGHLGAAGRELIPSGPVEVRARATNTGHGAMLVQGKARASLKATCDRCLAPFDLGVESEFEQQYKNGRDDGRPRQTAGGDDSGQDEREYHGDFIDIGPEVRESLSLAIPMKLVCSDECRGLCPSCGRNLNEGLCDCPAAPGDIRLAALLDIGFRENGKADRKD
ncbi:MAG: DUF177 domain-containing protein [Bacillota bacterium]|nr:DUF177 domain-containing protein [Bacillota bacterium]